MPNENNQSGPRVETDPWYTSSPYEPSLPPVQHLEEIDLTDPELYHRGDPHAAWRLLREKAPVFWHEKGTRGTDGKGFWVLTRYDDIIPVYKNAALFSSEKGPFLDMLVDDTPRKILPSMDGRMHQVRKGLVSRLFGPRELESLTESVRATAVSYLDAVAERGECDFSAEIAEEFPIKASCDMLGISAEEAGPLAHMVIEQDSTSPEAMARFNDAVFQFFANLMDERRKGGARDTVVDVVARAEIDGEPLPEEDKLHLLWVLFLGGIDSTAHAMTGGLLALFHHPDQLDILRQEPALVGHAIDEILRWTSTSHANKRHVTEDTEIRGTRIKKGDFVTMWSPSANRDELAFEDPYRFYVRRKMTQPIVTFGGGGAHQCIGQHFARLEIKILFEELLTRFPDVEQAGPAIRSPAYTMQISPLTSVPIRFTPRAVNFK